MAYAEGTCTNRECLISFKPGAFIPGIPVQPVVIQYKNKFDCMTWTWDSPSMMRLLFYTLCQFHNYMEITVRWLVFVSRSRIKIVQIKDVQDFLSFCQLLCQTRKKCSIQDCMLKIRGKLWRREFKHTLFYFLLLKTIMLSFSLSLSLCLFWSAWNTTRYLNVPVTNHTFEDCRLMLLAKNRRLPFESGLIEFAKIKEKLGYLLFSTTPWVRIGSPKTNH